jgi:hypothetical protein
VLLAVLEPASAAVVDSTANGFTIENTADVPADAMTSWKALVDDVGVWWPRDHTWWGQASELTIEPRANGVLEFRLAPGANGGTRITLFYRAGGYAPDDLKGLAPIVDQVQALQLGGLAKHLRGR